MTIESSSKIRIICVSDTHSHRPGEGYTLPAGDILIHAGDLTNQGSSTELRRAARWLELAAFDIKIIVAGNHELSLDENYELKHTEGWRVQPTNVEECRQLIRSIPGVIYLEHESCDINCKGRVIRVFGSPFSMGKLKQNWAFQYSLDADIWQQIPQDTDILITHTPPAGILDESRHWTEGGCPKLLEHMRRVKPSIHVFGHHHEGRGATIVDWNNNGALHPWTPETGARKQSLLDLTKHSAQGTAAVNASIVKNSWSASGAKEFNKPIVVVVSAESFGSS